MASEATTLQSEDSERLYDHPIVVADILRKRHAMKRELLKQTNLVPTRIAILGGSTTTEVKSMLGVVSPGAGNSTNVLRIGIQPLLRGRCVRKS